MVQSAPRRSEDVISSLYAPQTQQSLFDQNETTDNHRPKNKKRNHKRGKRE